jgi:two-component system, LytTR family, sensor kinase
VHNLHAQNEKDSLLNLLKNHPKQDTIRCMLLITCYEENRMDDDMQALNIELKNTLLAILEKPELQQTKKEWYIKLLVTSLLYEGQDILKHTANYTRALKSYFTMLRYAESINYDEGKAGAYNDISTTYFKQKYYKESILYCLKFIDLSKKMRDSVFISSGFSNLAHTYLTINEIDKSEAFYKEAIIIKSRVEPKRLGILYNGLGNVWRKRNNTDSALFYYNKALVLNESLKLKRFYVRNYENIALTYIDKNEPALAEKNALKSLSIAQEINEPEHIKSAALILSNLYSKSGKLKEAFAMLQLSSAMKDSIVNDENKQSLLKAEMDYQYQLNESEVKQLEQKNEITQLQSQRKNTIIYSILVLIIAFVLILYFLFARYKSKRQNELLVQKLQATESLRESEQKASDSEIKAIKSQMNPHFFYNALNSIQGYIYNGDKTSAAKALGLFSDLSRAVLESSRNTEISLHDEIELLENYLQLETMRLPKIKYELNALNLNLHDIFIPAMILQPLVENAIKHGLANKLSDCLLTINFTQNNNNLYISIHDNGIGRKAAEEIGKALLKKSASFSTDANMSRIELLNANKTEKIQQTIIDNADANGLALGTTIELIIPLDND